MTCNDPILIVEDECILAEWTAGWFRDIIRVTNVFIATSGAAALRLARFTWADYAVGKVRE